MLAITFALPQESQDLRALIPLTKRANSPLPGALFGAVNGTEIVVLHCGVGKVAAGRQTAALIDAFHPRCVIATGFAGALDPKIRLADLVVSTNFSDPALLAAAVRAGNSATKFFQGTLVTSDAAAETVAQKAELAAKTGGLAVDMESSAAAAACMASRIPFLAVRSISDTAADPLPVPLNVWFDLERQQPRAFPLLAYLAAHPKKIMPFARFVFGLAPARASLASFLLRLIAELPDEPLARLDQ